MPINDKISQAVESAWISDFMTSEEELTAKYIGQIAASIQRQRKAKGYTQQELANKIGITQVMVSRWENGEENFTVATLAKISKALDMALYNPLEKHAG
jgi:ribosome-binding protein aMBF1 (putative translation factor)